MIEDSDIPAAEAMIRVRIRPGPGGDFSVSRATLHGRLETDTVDDWNTNR